jgi:hypothetical protein
MSSSSTASSSFSPCPGNCWNQNRYRGRLGAKRFNQENQQPSLGLAENWVRFAKMGLPIYRNVDAIDAAPPFMAPQDSGEHQNLRIAVLAPRQGTSFVPIKRAELRNSFLHPGLSVV